MRTYQLIIKTFRFDVIDNNYKSNYPQHEGKEQSSVIIDEADINRLNQELANVKKDNEEERMLAEFSKRPYLNLKFLTSK